MEVVSFRLHLVWNSTPSSTAFFYLQKKLSAVEDKSQTFPHKQQPNKINEQSIISPQLVSFLLTLYVGIDLINGNISAFHKPTYFTISLNMIVNKTNLTYDRLHNQLLLAHLSLIKTRVFCLSYSPPSDGHHFFLSSTDSHFTDVKQAQIKKDDFIIGKDVRIFNPFRLKITLVVNVLTVIIDLAQQLSLLISQLGAQM